MTSAKTSKLVSYLAQRELSLCVTINRHCHHHIAYPPLFDKISRLGDGVAWYGLMIAIVLFDPTHGWQASLHMSLVAALCLVIYKWLKPRTMRYRPYLKNTNIQLSTAPLDYYSFPSGHTLHAVAFSCTALHYYPELAWVLIPFTSLIALSRIVLGLHYPSDVIVGALIGASLANISFMVL